MSIRSAQLLLALLATWVQAPAAPPVPSPALEATRAARPWEFLSATGPKAALLGHENGRFEAWVYPLKLFKDFHLRFRSGGQILDGEALVRTVSVRPEATTLVYAWDTFRVEETLCVPPDAAGAIVRLRIDSAQPLEVEVLFTRDFQLQWPAAVGGQDLDWSPEAKAFRFSEPSQRYAALVGSPAGDLAQGEDATNYTAFPESSLRLARVDKGRHTQTIVLAASTQGPAEAERTYRKLCADPEALLAGASAWYDQRLEGTLQLDLPDPELQKAYAWARVGLIQGMVENPLLGQGLVAGYRTSGNDYRPGFAWFFGRDALWCSLALDAAGAYPDTRKALAFLARYQRADGKVPHEISQSASLVPWFKDLPWAWAAADATPLFLIAMDDYVTTSGDQAFAVEQWDPLWRASQWLKSTCNAAGFPKNGDAGTGWVEGGPLFGVETELYQSAVGLEALRAMAHLAAVAGRAPLSRTFTQAFEQGREHLNRAFWIPGTQRFAFGLEADGSPLDAPSVLATVPMWFGLLDGDKAARMIQLLAEPEHQADWGMRILSDQDPRYEPGGYHSGSVWPLFTGWASVGEYQYHRAFPAYANLRANALLTLEGSPGHVTEVLAGDSHQTLSTGSPHQIWSAAMVVAPLVKGLLGLTANVAEGTLRFAPHLPAGWRHLGLRNARVGPDRFDLDVTRDERSLAVTIQPQGQANRRFVFSPALSPRARITSVTLDGQATPFQVTREATDQHVTVTAQVAGAPRTLVIHVTDDFGLQVADGLPPLGCTSRGLRVLQETWSADQDGLDLDLAGPAGATFDLGLWNPDALLSVEGATLLGTGSNAKLRVPFPPGEAGTYLHRHLRLRFRPAGKAPASQEQP